MLNSIAKLDFGAPRSEDKKRASRRTGARVGIFDSYRSATRGIDQTSRESTWTREESQVRFPPANLILRIISPDKSSRESSARIL